MYMYIPRGLSRGDRTLLVCLVVLWGGGGGGETEEVLGRGEEEEEGTGVGDLDDVLWPDLEAPAMEISHYFRPY